jgi:hypothetical protein
MSNKAHTATLNRISQRYGVKASTEGSYDIRTDQFIIEVETSASIDDAIERLRGRNEAVYIAVTNKEGVSFAVQKVAGTAIGIMDPQGNVIRPSGDHPAPTPTS